MSAYWIPGSLVRAGGKVVKPGDKPVELSDLEVQALERHHGPSSKWPSPADKEKVEEPTRKAAPLPRPSPKGSDSASKGGK